MKKKFLLLIWICLAFTSVQQDDPRHTKTEYLQLRNGEEVVFFEGSLLSSSTGYSHEIVTQFKDKYYLKLNNLEQIGPFDKHPRLLSHMDKKFTTTKEDEELYFANNTFYSPWMNFRKTKQTKKPDFPWEKALDVHIKITKKGEDYFLTYPKKNLKLGPYERVQVIKTGPQDLIFIFQKDSLYYVYNNERIEGSYKEPPFPWYYDDQTREFSYTYVKGDDYYIKGNNQSTRIGPVESLTVMKNMFRSKTDTQFVFAIHEKRTINVLKMYSLEDHKMVNVNTYNKVFLHTFSDGSHLRIHSKSQHGGPGSYSFYYKGKKHELRLLERPAIGNRFADYSVYTSKNQFAVVVRKPGKAPKTMEEMKAKDKYLFHNGKLHGPHRMVYDLKFEGDDLYYRTEEGMFINHQFIAKEYPCFVRISDSTQLSFYRNDTVFHTLNESWEKSFHKAKKGNSIYIKYIPNEKEKYVYHFNTQLTAGPFKDKRIPKIRFSENDKFFGYQYKENNFLNTKDTIYINEKQFGEGFFFRKHPHKPLFTWFSQEGQKLYFHEYRVD